MSSTLLSGDPTYGTGKSIGRYFGIVSTVPSTLLAGWLYLIWSTGVLVGKPSVAHMTTTFEGANVRSLATVLIFALVLAILVHPVQFALIQIWEGYWGSSRFGLLLRWRRSEHHLAVLKTASSDRAKAFRSRRTFGLAPDEFEHELRDGNRQTRKRLLRPVLAYAAAGERSSRYPDQASNVMPTRLGNVLRRHEARAGAAFGLPIVTFANHIGMVAEPKHTAYVNDQRAQLDLAVRTTTLSSFATAATAALMWPYGVWALATLLPFAAAWGSYRGSLVAASSYAQAFSAWVDLNRFRLYDALQMEVPQSAAAERISNSHLIDMVNGSTGFTMIYRKAVASASVDDKAPGTNPDEQEPADSGA